MYREGRNTGSGGVHRFGSGISFKQFVAEGFSWSIFQSG